MPSLTQKPALDPHYSKPDTKSAENLSQKDLDDIDALFADLDMSPEVDTDASSLASLADLDTSDDVAPPDPVAPLADWMADVRELARKHGPFAPWQIIQIIRTLNAPADEAVR